MASVNLKFSAPGQENLAELRIYESPTQDGFMTLIETVTDIGAFPDYINSYTTDQADDVTDWFSIQWVDDKGAESEMSDPWQGNTDSVVAQIVERVIQRGSDVEESVVIQEAELAAETYFNKDPYAVELPVSRRVLMGLVYLTLARSLSLQTSQSGGESFTAGLVQMKSDSKAADVDVTGLLDEAATLLGLKRSVVAEMAELPIAGGSSVRGIDSVLLETDQSRLLGVVGLP